MARKEKRFGKVVGVTEDGEVYILDYTFESTLHGSRFAGAVGTNMRPVTREEYDYLTQQEQLEDRFEDIWREMASSGATDESLEDFAARAFAVDGDDVIFDQSGMDHWEEAERYVKRLPQYQDEEIELFECTGGGRVFSSFDTMEPMFVLMPNTELWLEINRAERRED